MSPRAWGVRFHAEGLRFLCYVAPASPVIMLGSNVLLALRHGNPQSRANSLKQRAGQQMPHATPLTQVLLVLCHGQPASRVAARK